MPRCSDLKRPRFPIPQVRNVPFKRLSFVINRHNLIQRFYLQLLYLFIKRMPDNLD